MPYDNKELYFFYEYTYGILYTAHGCARLATGRHKGDWETQTLDAFSASCLGTSLFYW